jgi:EAL domain-containing protein (putative c-di-GMP-specific phosphodiesterase class I)
MGHRGEAARRGWEQRVRGVLQDPRRLGLVTQPIVDLHRGEVAGYEVLSRFAGSAISPRYWFHAADRLGLGPELEATVLERALELRQTLPDGLMLSVNATPAHVTEPQVSDVLLGAGDLSGVVVELTGDVPAEAAGNDGLTRLVGQLRGQGATVAALLADPEGSEVAADSALRPDVVRVRPAAVDGLVIDEVGARGLLAERIESVEHLDASLRLGLPLGQGWLLGVPADPWPGLDPGLSKHIRRAGRAPGEPGDVGALVRRTCVLVGAGRAAVERVFAGDRGLTEVVVLDGQARFSALYVRRTDSAPGPVALRVTDPVVVHASTLVAETGPVGAQPAGQADPLICLDAGGRILGIVDPTRLRDVVALSA